MRQTEVEMRKFKRKKKNNTKYEIDIIEKKNPKHNVCGWLSAFVTKILLKRVGLPHTNKIPNVGRLAQTQNLRTLWPPA